MNPRNLKLSLNFFVMAIAMSISYTQLKHLSSVGDIIVGGAIAFALTVACCYLLDAIVDWFVQRKI